MADRNTPQFTLREVAAAVCNFVALAVKFGAIEAGSEPHRNLSKFVMAFQKHGDMVDGPGDCGDHIGYGNRCLELVGAGDPFALLDWDAEVLDDDENFN
jgi:hypothetical protein